MLSKLIPQSVQTKPLLFKSFSGISKIKRRGKATCRPVKTYSDLMHKDYIKMLLKNPKLIFKTSAAANIHFLNAVKSEPVLRKSPVRE